MGMDNRKRFRRRVSCHLTEYVFVLCEMAIERNANSAKILPSRSTIISHMRIIINLRILLFDQLLISY